MCKPQQAGRPPLIKQIRLIKQTRMEVRGGLIIILQG